MSKRQHEGSDSDEPSSKRAVDHDNDEGGSGHSELPHTNDKFACSVTCSVLPDLCTLKSNLLSNWRTGGVFSPSENRQSAFDTTCFHIGVDWKVAYFKYLLSMAYYTVRETRTTRTKQLAADIHATRKRISLLAAIKRAQGPQVVDLASMMLLLRLSVLWLSEAS